MRQDFEGQMVQIRLVLIQRLRDKVGALFHSLSLFGRKIVVLPLSRFQQFTYRLSS